jgi:mannose-1-phosphate guanylyltransferase
MFQETMLRLADCSNQTSIVVCNEEHRFLAADQLRAVGETKATIILEPASRNTAPAIALAALKASQNGEDPLLLVMPSDHRIKDAILFRDRLRDALELASQGKLVTFGVRPEYPETGYGYIEAGNPLDSGGFAVARFHEKPDLLTAEAYVSSGNHYWNSGMFVFRASRYLDELEAHEPDVLRACTRAMNAESLDMSFCRPDKEAFETSPAISVDFAVMEKTDAAAVVPLDAGWSDIGSWSAFWADEQSDENKNVLKGNVLESETHDSLVLSEHRLVAVLGVSDLIVIETADAVLVAQKDRSQEVKEIVEQLRTKGRTEGESHRKVYRPWGNYDLLDRGPRDQVKRITVDPGAKLSVQMHHHRAEYWVVVKGSGYVQKGKERLLVIEGQSIYIPAGEIHSLENSGKIPLELIEVQIGSYLGEDDIIRFDDRYGRP